MPNVTIRSYFTNLAYEKFQHVSTLAGSIKPNTPDESYQRELIATRQAVKAKTGGENLDKTPKAKDVNQTTAEYKDSRVMEAVLDEVVKNPKGQTLALKGHGGKFTEIVLESAKLRNAPEQEKTADNSKQRSAVAGPEKAKQ